MKKFCSTCGNQLELSQRFCNECGAVNPFFVTAFTFLSDQSDELEKLRLEKERIDKELAEKEEKQAEFIRQEQLKKEAEEAERLKLEKEKAIKEQLEIGKEEMNLRKEIIKRVKEEAEQYKTETSDLVKQVREELHLIEEDNKRLKEEIALLSLAKQAEKTEVFSPLPVQMLPEKSSKERAVVVSLFVILLALTSFLAFYYFTNHHDERTIETPLASKQEVILKPNQILPVLTDTMQVRDTATAVADTVPLQTKTVSVPGPSKPESRTTKPETEPIQPKNEFILTESKIKKDLIGKKISGCDIVIGSASQIESVSNLVLIEKSASGYLKYKFTTVIVQGSDTFTAVPYIYYSIAGAFIKLDGTNCE